MAIRDLDARLFMGGVNAVKDLFVSRVDGLGRAWREVF